jgi:hypothetical protein
MRARISRHVQAAWLGAMAFVVGTLLLFDRGSYALGAVALVPTALVTWLAGVWVGPRGVDAYQRRVARALRDWRTAASNAWDRAAAERTRIAARLARVDVPAAVCRFASACGRSSERWARSRAYVRPSSGPGSTRSYAAAWGTTSTQAEACLRSWMPCVRRRSQAPARAPIAVKIAFDREVSGYGFGAATRSGGGFAPGRRQAGA